MTEIQAQEQFISMVMDKTKKAIMTKAHAKTALELEGFNQLDKPEGYFEIEINSLEEGILSLRSMHAAMQKLYKQGEFVVDEEYSNVILSPYDPELVEFIDIDDLPLQKENLFAHEQRHLQAYAKLGKPIKGTKVALSISYSGQPETIDPAIIITYPSELSDLEKAYVSMAPHKPSMIDTMHPIRILSTISPEALNAANPEVLTKILVKLNRIDPHLVGSIFNIKLEGTPIAKEKARILQQIFDKTSPELAQRFRSHKFQRVFNT